MPSTVFAVTATKGLRNSSVWAFDHTLAYFTRWTSSMRDLMNSKIPAESRNGLPLLNEQVSHYFQCPIQNVFFTSTWCAMFAVNKYHVMGIRL